MITLANKLRMARLPNITSLTIADWDGQDSAHAAYPADIESGDLLFAVTHGGTAWASLAGWNGAYETRGALGWKIADGSETGTAALTTTVPSKAGIVVLRANRRIKSMSFARKVEDYAGGFTGVSVNIDGTTYGDQPKFIASWHMGSSSTDTDVWDVGSPTSQDLDPDIAFKFQTFFQGATDLNITASQRDSGTFTMIYGLIVELE